MSMPSARRRTAWALAGSAILGLLAGCGQPDPLPVLDACPADATPIGQVQGGGYTSPRLGDTLSVSGVVTRVSGTGVYLESLAPDDDPRTSEGLFLALNPPRGLDEGAVITARGQVEERGERRDTQTTLAAIETIALCAPPAPRPLQAITLPLDNREREALENMRVRIDSASVVTDVYNLHEGGFLVARDRPLPQPTEVARPGPEARAQADRNRADILYVRLAPGDESRFALGDELLSDEGVLGHDGIGPRLLLETPARLLREPTPVPPPVADGALRVLSLNLRNYFNGDGRGGGFPAPRGPRSASDFRAQRERLGAQVAAFAPDLLAVMELENDGFDDDSAAASLLEDLDRHTGESWSVARPRVPRIGTDEITVGLFYRDDRLEPIGPARTLDAAPFDLLNRVPLAQVFAHRDSGERFLVSINHFKSKGGCPEQGRDQDQNDGQGCWNPARLAAAKALAPWVRSLAEELAEGRALVVGDLNAYRMEEPVQHLLMSGFVDLTASAGQRHRHSYVYFGQSGTLDHALATPDLLANVVGAGIVNVNAGQPRRLPLEPAWLGASDHDPVLVDLRFTQSSTAR